MRLPAPQGDLRPELRSGDARHPLLHRLPEADRPALRGRRRRRRRAREGRGPARLRRRRDAGRARRDRAAARARRRGLDPLGAARVRGRRGPRGRLHGDRGDERHRREHRRLRGRRAARDARERRRRAAALQLHPAGDHPHRPARDRDLHGRRQPALAKRIRDEIADEYGEPYARLAILLNDVRGWAKGTLPDLPGPQGVLRVDRQRRPRPGRAAAPRRRAGRARPDRGGAARPRSLPDELSHLDDAGQRPDGRRGRQGRDRPPRGRAGGGADVAGDRRRRRARRRPEGRRGRHRPPRRHPGRQAHRRADPALPPAAAVVRGRAHRGARRPRGDRGRGAHQRRRRAWRWRR